MFKLLHFALFFLVWSAPFSAIGEEDILPMRERAQTIDRLLNDRLEKIPQRIMRREGIAMWVLIAREYNEDPVVKTMLPASSLSARRRTILVFSDEGATGVKGYAVSRYRVGEFFEPVWNPDEQADQWLTLAELIAEKSPATIALNTSRDFALADGLSHGDYLGLHAALTSEQRSKIVSAEPLAVGWLEARTVEEVKIYPSLVEIAHRIIEEGFSTAVITAGDTTTDEVMWWFRDRLRQLGLQAWFHPSVAIQRVDGGDKSFIDSFTDTQRDAVILPGDLLHVDFGLTYLRLNTDTQQHAYVLKPGEIEAPEGLRAAMAKANQLQDILTSNFQKGRTGNEVLKIAREQALSAGLRPAIYTHPIGFHGHGAGPTIGMWDNQDDTVGRGDYPLHENTAYAIELNVTVSIPEWAGKDVRIMLEEDAFFDGKTVKYMQPRQTELILIDPAKEN